MTINRSGPIASGTRQNLINGLRSSPMPEAAVDATFEQAAEFVERLTDTYTTLVAAGEVGDNGTGIASEAEILGEDPATALLYGRVQSGKTAGMLLSSALSIDNGFRVIIVLTTNNVALVQQTANRFRDLDGPQVFSTVKNDGSYEWEGQEDDISEDIASEGLVLVLAKNHIHIPQVYRFLQEVGASSYPAIIFDDEADAATPDTSLAARSMGHANAPDYASTTHRQIIANDHPDEEGESIREMLPHSLYVQVTATPFVLLLQSSGSNIRPDLTHLLEPGQGYCGGQEFFGGVDVTSTDDPLPPLVFVPPSERHVLTRSEIPSGLEASLNFFLISAAAKSIADGEWPREGYKHLSHPSRLINHHTIVANHIENYRRTLRRLLRQDSAAAQNQFTDAYSELQRTVNNPPPLEEIMELLPEAIRQADIRRVNSESDPATFGPRINFLIGGDILGRGITVDKLLVTYYVRESQISQMDTVWQHARMYGYREALMPYTRVYLPRQLAINFKRIHEAEEELRILLNEQASGAEVPIKLGLGMRATRPNALDPTAISVIRGSRNQLYPLHLETPSNDDANEILQLLNGAGVPINASQMQERASEVDLDVIRQIANLIPVRDGDLGSWSLSAIATILNANEDQYAGLGTVYVRGLEASASPAEGWTSGRLSGDEVSLIQETANGLPALALMYTGEPDNPSAWYPTLVMPRNSANYLVAA